MDIMIGRPQKKGALLGRGVSGGGVRGIDLLLVLAMVVLPV